MKIISLSHPLASTLRGSILLWALTLCTSWSLLAYPPAPPHLIHGMVRDEMGNPLDLSNAFVILESSLIEEEGNFVVFVHVSGESFEKRTITTGIRNRGWVEVTSGLSEGEHIVTQNAYQVKLASLSTEAPAHGHSH